MPRVYLATAVLTLKDRSVELVYPTVHVLRKVPAFEQGAVMGAALLGHKERLETHGKFCFANIAEGGAGLRRD